MRNALYPGLLFLLFQSVLGCTDIFLMTAEWLVTEQRIKPHAGSSLLRGNAFSYGNSLFLFRSLCLEILEFIPASRALFLKVVPKQDKPHSLWRRVWFGLGGFFAGIVCHILPIVKNGQAENKQNARRAFEVQINYFLVHICTGRVGALQRGYKKYL